MARRRARTLARLSGANMRGDEIHIDPKVGQLLQVPVLFRPHFQQQGLDVSEM
jgi:hypothetical protein